jgi:hypothetical protein
MYVACTCKKENVICSASSFIATINRENKESLHMQQSFKQFYYESVDPKLLEEGLLKDLALSTAMIFTLLTGSPEAKAGESSKPSIQQAQKKSDESNLTSTRKLKEILCQDILENTGVME